jgi:hypothetical protein
VTPDAIPPELRRRGGSPRQVLALCLVGTLVLALFASRDLPGWADRFEDPGIARLAGEWDAAMARLGLVRPHEALREAMARLLAAGW